MGCFFCPFVCSLTITITPTVLFTCILVRSFGFELGGYVVCYLTPQG